VTEPLCPKCNYGRMVALFMSGPVCSHDCDRNPVPARKPSPLEACEDEFTRAPKNLLVVPSSSRAFNVGQTVYGVLTGQRGTVVAIDHRKNLVGVEPVKSPGTTLWLAPEKLTT
jgi:hypothetical protein